ncbi:hypothetical protein HLV40_14690 [Chromohalobacter salexigens]|nr:hypothetical protein [Chromohalobacter salexigens]
MGNIDVRIAADSIRKHADHGQGGIPKLGYLFSGIDERDAMPGLEYLD